MVVGARPRERRMQRIHPTSGFWLDLLPPSPSMEIRHVLEDLDGGRLRAHRYRPRHRQGRCYVWVVEVGAGSRWYGHIQGRGAPLRTWRRCPPLECLLGVLIHDVVTENLAAARPMVEVVQ